MKYDSKTIGNILERINNQYFLPAIQREYEWKPEQVVSLFDSLLRGYPIGSFLFWELKDDTRSKWPSYRFLESARQGGVRNDLVSLESIKNPVLILDGQQRLTSLLIGLRGYYTIKQKHARRNNPDAFRKCELFIDLLHDPNTKSTSESSGDSTNYYKLAFKHEADRYSAHEAWYPIGRILKYRDSGAFEDHRQEEEDAVIEANVEGRRIKTLRKNLAQIYNAIWRDDFVSYYRSL